MTQGAEDYDDFDTGPEELEETPLLDLDTTDRAKPKQARDWQPVKVDGELLHVRRPKGAFFIALANRMASGSELEQAAAMDDVLGKVFDEESAKHLRARLDDEEDEFDVDDVGMILTRLRELWSRGRPTGSASGSRPPRRRSGGPSTARSRSAG